MRKLTVSEIGLLRHIVTGEDTEIDTMSIDWEIVLESIRSHGLGPLLHHGAKRSAMPVPERVRNRLERAFHMELARNVVRLHHVEEIDRLALRSGRGISLLKGAAFATALYESPGARAMADVDVLVRHDEFALWTSEVEGLGFRAHESSDHAVCFRHPRTGVFLELHRDLTSEGRFIGLDASLLFDRASKAPGFLALATLSPEDHLVHLCLHASFQHGFRQPAINAWDARLLLRDAAFDQKTFITRASAPRLLPWVFGASSSRFPTRSSTPSWTNSASSLPNASDRSSGRSARPTFLPRKRTAPPVLQSGVYSGLVTLRQPGHFFLKYCGLERTKILPAL